MAYYFASGWKQVFKNDNFYSLHYVDLFSGDGICECNELDKYLEQHLPDDLSKRRWKPPFFKLMDFADGEDMDLHCIFNDKNSGCLKKSIHVFFHYLFNYFPNLVF